MKRWANHAKHSRQKTYLVQKPRDDEQRCQCSCMCGNQDRGGVRGMVENELSDTGRWQIMGKLAESLALTLGETDIQPIKNFEQRSGLT